VPKQQYTRFDLSTSVIIIVSTVMTMCVLMYLANPALLNEIVENPQLLLTTLKENRVLGLVMGLLLLQCMLLLAITNRRYRQFLEFQGKAVPNNSEIISTSIAENPSLHLVQASTLAESKEKDVSARAPENRNREELVELQSELVKTKGALELASSVKSQFLANMSHELRTPMNGILGMTELLMGSNLNDRQTRFADSVRRSAESLLAIINDLLDYSRMDSGNLVLEKATFNIRDLVEDVCDLHAEHAQNKGLELICHVDKEMHEHVSGDSNRIRQLLTNLIGNAVKFTKKGEVVVRIRENKESAKTHEGVDFLEIQLDVVDTGVGITPEGQARIFESFTQADDSYAREYGGAGLGLYITHRLVMMMGGKISLKSRMDQGSHFTVCIELEKATKYEPMETIGVSLEGVRILIVDDNETNRTILYHQLKSWGVIPEVVDSGKRALESLRAAATAGKAFHIAILDLHMPGMDGLELTREIQSDTEINAVKRMMLTSAVMELDKEHLSEIGISQYISKPARQAQLYSVLTDLAPEALLKRNRPIKNTEESFISLGAHVLLAEDNLINQEVAENMLQNFGCTTVVVSTGSGALKACEKVKFDIVLMDCQMPVMDGLEATRRLREGDSPNRDTAVIALTANVLDGDREKCLKSGMNGYIGKPVKQDELYRELSMQLGSGSEDKVVSISSVAENRESLESTVDSLPEKGSEIRTTDNISLGNEIGSAGDSANNSEDNLDRQTDLKTNVHFNKQSASPAEEKKTMSSINEAALETIAKLQRPGKPDLVAKVVNVYLDKSPELVDAIVNGVKDGDVIAVKEAAHSMKSSSAYIGAEQISEKFKLIESTAASGDLTEVQEVINGLTEEFAEVCHCLQGFINRAA